LSAGLNKGFFELFSSTENHCRFLFESSTVVDISKRFRTTRNLIQC
jgi:hypothetical protein